MGLHIADFCVLGVYFIGLVIIGVNESRKIKDSSDYFMPRKFGKVMMMMFSFGSGTHSDQAVSVAAKSFTNGISGIWYQWLWLPVTPFYWLIAPVMRRFRAITTSDVFEARFNRSVAVLFALVGTMNMIVALGLMLRGSSEVLSASTGGLVTADWTIAVMTVIFVVYGVFGGLSAAIFIDFIQGILIIVFSFLLLPLILNSVGGFTGLREGMADAQMLALVAPSDIGIFYIVVLAINGLVGIIAQPQTMANCAAGKTEMEGRVGFMTGNFLKRLCTIPWCLTGVVAVVYFAGRSIEPDQVFGTVANEFLPKIMPGILGIFIAGVMASVMSTCDAMMLSCSALFTENIYKSIKPNHDNKHYITVGRFACIGIVAGSVIYAYWIPNVIKGLEIFWKITPMMGLAFWLGLFWRRTTVAGAWAATITAFAVWWLTTKSFFISFMADVPGSDALRFVVEDKASPEIYLPWQMVFYLAAGLLAGIIISLLTKPVAKEKLDNFYALIRTPITPGEKVDAPCTLPKDAVVPEKRALFPNTSLEIMIPSRISVIGFLVGWAIVATIVSSVYIISKL